MYIDAFHIGSFGIYHDEGVRDLPPGLLLITGENESGKTTLLEFFRFMFFGPERRAADRNDYQPLVGRERTGRLVLVDRDGRRLVVERREKKVLLSENGSLLPADLLTARLGGVDRDTFRAVFAVDLKDLQGLKVLETEQVRSLIFGPGGGAGAAAVPRVLRSLDQELRDLLRPQSGGRLNAIFTRLQEIGQELRHLEAAAFQFAELKATQEGLEARLREQKEEVERLQARLARLRQLALAREPWVRWCIAREALAELPELEDFPPEGLAEHRRLKEAAADLQAEKDTLEAEAARLAGELAQMAPDPLLLRHREEIEAVLSEEKRWEEAMAREPEERLAVEQARAEARRRLENLGPGWDEGLLARVDTSLVIRHEVQEFGRRLGASERRYEELQSRERTLAENVAAAQREGETSRARLEATSRPPGELTGLQARYAWLRRLSPLLGQREVLAARLEERRRAVEELEERLRNWEKALFPAREGIPRWLVPLPVAVALIWAAVPLMLGTFPPPGELWPWLTVGGLLALGLMATMALALGRRHLRRRETWHQEQREQERQALSSRREAEGAEVARLEKEMARVTADLETLAQEAGEDLPSGTGEAATALAELERLLEDWRLWQAREQEYLKAQGHLAESERRLAEAREEREQAGRVLEETGRQWEAWLSRRGFPATLKPENVEVLLQMVEAARTALSQEKQARERLGQTQAVVTDIRSRLGQVLAACGLTPDGSEPGLADLKGLRRRLREALDLEGRRQDLQQRLTAVQTRLADLTRKQARVAEEQARLWRQAHAADDAGFMQRATRYQEWLSWRQQYHESLLQLTTVAGSESLREDLERELAETDPQTLEREEEELQRRLAELNEEISAGEREVGRLGTELERLAGERRLGDLLQEKASLEEQVARLSRHYVTVALARHLIEAARQVYEREHQPRVIAEADRFLRLMTQGRYRLFAPVGEGGVRLEDATHRQKEEVHWSAGLADQVYLAVRLGMAREFSRHCEPLPLILDDVLVKFDPSRRQRAARVLLECAREQQVLLFSSHPEYERFFREAAREPEFQEVPVKYLHLQSGKMAWAS